MKRRARAKKLPPMDPVMKEAYDELVKWGIRPMHLTEYQLKIGCVNYYPGNGTIVADGEVADARSGLPALHEVLQERGLLKRQRPDGQGPTVVKLGP